MNQFKFDFGSEIYAIRSGKTDDAADLLALGSEHSVEILIVAATGCKSIASFHIGARITALAFSPRTISPGFSDDWLIELTAASADFGLHLLTKLPTSDETVFPFGGGLSGHHGRVNDMTFCGGKGADSTRYVATVSGVRLCVLPRSGSKYGRTDDKMLMVWDLYPTLDTSASNRSSVESMVSGSSSPPPRLQPTAYVIAFPHPLTTVSSHPSSSKEFLVSDARGSIFLTDWRSDPDENDFESWRLVELIEPHALAACSMGLSVPGGWAAWRGDNADIVGAVYGSRYSLWDISRLQGGKPSTGHSFPQGGHRFRWCPTFPEYFAISTQSPAKGAVINVHNTTYAQPTTVSLAPRPNFIRDFDWLASRTPRIAAAVGRTVIVFSVALDSTS
ncbi:hypothetical protein DFH07DRAFT_867220 [Mycena maculata]|uniref:WD40 repeat-like protein n=1 Tax=Mycena maculata TaxID=230809 RepID=A0AAD7JGL7_9AGAR|nr:hypothetical protein DFH07DRAFT_867220 [Mycena maculata]